MKSHRTLTSTEPIWAGVDVGSGVPQNLRLILIQLILLRYSNALTYLLSNVKHEIDTSLLLEMTNAKCIGLFIFYGSVLVNIK